MTNDELNDRLLARCNYMQHRLGRYSGPAGELGLEMGDEVKLQGPYPGWTQRELKATPHFHTTISENDSARLAYLCSYWLAEWNGGPNLALVQRLQQLEKFNAAQAAAQAAKAVAAQAAAQAAKEVVEAKYDKDYVIRWGPQSAYRSKTFDNFKAETSKQEAALEAASAFPYDASDDYETRYYTNLVLAGPAGVGKTHLAAAMFTNAWIYYGQAAEFVTSTALMRKFREKGAKESALLARYGDGKHDATDPLDQGCEFLIIDDIGVEADAYSSQIFCEILDRRIGADLLTVITTNCTAEELRLWLGERGFSRLRSRCSWNSLDGDDHRLRDPRPQKTMKVSK